MTLPWYLDRPAPAAPHAGLLFDKYCAEWSASYELSGDGAKKPFLLDVVLRTYNANDAISSAVTRANVTRSAMVLALHGQTKPYVTVERVVSGLGMNHVLDNGFAWHPTLSVPYFPGSSIKGMVRAWADPEKGWADREGWEETVRLFGDGGDEDGGSAGATPSDAADQATACESKSARALGAGTVVVFDALPVGRPIIDLDIMNVHYSDYYRHAGAPADYTSPNLIYFLAVAAGQEFQFSIAPRPSRVVSVAQAKNDVETAFRLLTEALQVLGLGAKTAAGYGRFRPK